MLTKKYIWVLVFALALAECLMPKHATPLQSSDLQEKIRKVFSGDRALATVASLEADPWRLAGNKPFNRAIALGVEQLEKAGYILEADARPSDRLIYRIEKRRMDEPTWEPKSASLTIVGQSVPLLDFKTNMNMIAVNSYSTPIGGVEAELVSVGRGRPEDLEGKELAGKIVLVDYPYPPPKFVTEAYKLGVIGVVMYVPSYPMKEAPTNSIQFHYFNLDAGQWVVLLSSNAKENLFKAVATSPVPLRVHVDIQTLIYESDEQMIVAEILGSSAPEERFVSSGHVSEPGANDNASGVGTQVELARTLAQLLKKGQWNPSRTVTFIWGDEIGAVEWFLTKDPKRAKGVKWGISLDMVGETENFLVEKTGDPSAIWTRGKDHHSGWGGEKPISADQLFPSFLNDFVVGRCLDQAATNGWKVRANPFEGGSDHVSFIDAGVPAVLFNHYPDTAYHHDNDRLGRVNPIEMANVGVCAGSVAAILTTADGAAAQAVVDEVKVAALERLATEFKLSQAEVAKGGKLDQEVTIITTWTEWYARALQTTQQIEVGGPSPSTTATIDAAIAEIKRVGEQYVAELKATTPPSH